nr:MAG: hypothetical protein 3 [Leviviridae sp.]
MKNRFELWQVALEELGARCSVSTALDINIVERRMKHEGDAFFDITLPKFGKDFERALAHEGVVEGLFVGWKRQKAEEGDFFSPVTLSTHRQNLVEVPRVDPDSDDPKYVRAMSAGIGSREWDPVHMRFMDELETREMPVFLGGFLGLVFQRKTSLLIHHDTPREGLSTAEETHDFHRQVEAVQALRQLTLMFGKVEQECSPARNQAAVLQYLETDRQIEETLERITSRPDFFNRDIIPLKKTLLTVFGDVLTRLDAEIYEGSLVPAHGPGATADALVGNQKFRQSEWTDRLEALFPYGEYALPNWRHAYALEDVTWRSPEDERPVRVVLVPKTASTPRVIAIEPTCMQYIQQALGRRLVALLESDPKASSFVGFSEQWPNQVMAQIGSEDGSLATLDLSEASDRVPNWLVEELLENWPHVSEAFQVSRSLRADVPGVGVIPLQKYASMGSALTFPVEAMVFATIALSGISSSDSKPGSWKAIKAYQDTVRVYGDDIIVPTTHAVTVMRSLEFFGFKVNSAKSFWTGGFRESCGKEYYRGQDVSIVKFRQVLPQSLRDVTEIMSTVDTRNQLFQAGHMGLVRVLDGVLEKVLKGHYPYVAETSPVLGRLSPSGLYEIQTMDRDLHAPLVRGYVSSSRSPVNSLDGWHALLKCLLMDGGTEPSNVTEHLTRSGRPRAASIKLAYGRPF